MRRVGGAPPPAAASTHRVFEILDRAASVPEPIAAVDPGRVEGAIELRGVAFNYGPRRVLSGLDIKIQPGEMIGLVGHTGAGKTTLINLICRFFDVAEGAILVDGVDIRSFPVEAYRSNIGIVLQEPFLFFGSIAENIAYGRPDADLAAIERAACEAHADGFILALPQGYSTILGERGSTLSGDGTLRANVILGDGQVSPGAFSSIASDGDPDFVIKSTVYHDLRTKGYTPRTGYKFGHHFRVYTGSRPHSEMLIHAVGSDASLPMNSISRSVRLAHSVKKKMLFGCVHSTGIHYLEFARVKL
jgi:ABC-type oligopeptide transport system ATPase subunit